MNGNENIGSEIQFDYSDGLDEEHNNENEATETEKAIEEDIDFDDI